ncbi:OB-fold nucleic acid binding domain protein [[Clostridium] sordellii ATCC 9714]|nr:OB-fold nucleic acid binding domain protein [[Clostridium] sordellii ATCC 9714] [Paeniclostridium sordellii ATCC 9714]
MTFTKIIILVITLFSFSYFDINSLNSNDTIPPKVNIISPCNAEQYIVSRPIIKASFSDNVRINKSSVKLFLNYKDVTSDCSISEDIITYKPKFKLKRGSQIVKLQVKDTNNNKTNLEWYFTVGSPSYNHYYGLLHSHTLNSDGHGTYEDAYYKTKQNQS